MIPDGKYPAALDLGETDDDDANEVRDEGTAADTAPAARHLREDSKADSGEGNGMNGCWSTLNALAMAAERMDDG